MATYYFSTTDGDDSRNSTQAQSPSTPWSAPAGMPGSTSTAAAFVFTSGDTLLFKRGDIWEFGANAYYNVVVADYPNGTGHYTFGAYYNSDGSDDPTQPKPIWWQRGLYDQTSDWTHDGSGIWKTASITAVEVYRCFFETVPQCNDATSSTVTATNPWWWDDSAGADDGKLWVYNGDVTNSPADTYGTIWTCEDDNGYMVRSYQTAGEFTVENIEFRGARGAAWSHVTGAVDAKNMNFVGCDFNYCVKGVAFTPVGAAILENIRVANCTYDTYFTEIEAGATEGGAGTADDYFSNGSNFVSLGSGTRGVLVENNVARRFGHTAVNHVVNNPAYSAFGNCVIRNNLFEGANKWHGRGIGITLDTDSTALAGGVIDIYGNIIQNTRTRNQLDGYNIRFHHNLIRNTLGDTASDWNGEGININARTDGAVSNVDVYNNTIYNTRENSIKVVSTSGEVLDGPVRVFNNILYQGAGWQDDDQQSLTNIVVQYGTAESNLADLEIYNNCLFHGDLGIGGAVVDYSSGGGTTMTLATAESTMDGSSRASMHDNIEADPMLGLDYSPSTGSPCFNTGVGSPTAFDLYSKPNRGLHLGAVWPERKASQERR